MEQKNFATFGDAVLDMIDLLQEMVLQIMNNDMEEYNNNILRLSVLMQMVIPRIIVSYSDERLKEVSEDAMYWSSQLGRIIEALNNNDKFVQLDVLYHETGTNLQAYYDMVKDTDILEQVISEEELNAVTEFKPENLK